MLSDSPPDRDIQWSNEGVQLHTNLYKNLGTKWKNFNKEEIKSSKDEEKEFSSKLINIYIKLLI